MYWLAIWRTVRVHVWYIHIEPAHESFDDLARWSGGRFIVWPTGLWKFHSVSWLARGGDIKPLPRTGRRRAVFVVFAWTSEAAAHRVQVPNGVCFRFSRDVLRVDGQQPIAYRCDADKSNTMLLWTGTVFASHARWFYRTTEGCVMASGCSSHCVDLL